MARDLSDVLHYFIDEPAAAKGGRPARAVPVGAPRLTVVLDPAEALRHAIVERLARGLGQLATAEAPSRIVVPGQLGEPLGKAPPPPGVRRIAAPSDGPAELERAADRVARDGPGWVLTLVPEAWLPCLGDAPALLASSLLFASPDEGDLETARHQAETLHRAAPDGSIGVTIHDVTSLPSAECAFLELARRVEAGGLDRLLSYGAVLCERSVLRGTLGPSDRADAAVRDVASLLHHDLVGAAA